MGVKVLSVAKKKDMDPSEFGLPDKKKYPMPDRAHVLSAIRFFNYADKEDQKELAANIIKKIKQFGMEDEITVGKKNAFSQYFQEGAEVVGIAVKDAVERLFIATVINKHNIHMLHWNCTGKDFDPTHEKLNEYVSQMGGYVDEIAEIMKMFGGSPLSLLECVEKAKADDFQYICLTSSETFDSAGVWAQCNKIFDQMLNLYTEAADGAPTDISSKFDEHIYWYRLEGKYKGTSRTK